MGLKKVIIIIGQEIKVSQYCKVASFLSVTAENKGDFVV